MGSLKKLAEWLSDGFKDEPQTTSPLIKIKVFTKRLQRQIGKMEIKEKLAKKRAIEARRTGDIKDSQLHMKSSLQYRKWGHSTEKFRMRMEGVQVKLEQAKIMGQFSKVATEIVGTLQGLQSQVDMPEIQKMLAEIDLGFGSMESIMHETTSQLETGEDVAVSGVSETEVEQALAEVDATFGIQEGLNLPSVPSSETPEAQIDNLEDEIKKLKQVRQD